MNGWNKVLYTICTHGSSHFLYVRGNLEPKHRSPINKNSNKTLSEAGWDREMVFQRHGSTFVWTLTPVPFYAHCKLVPRCNCTANINSCLVRHQQRWRKSRPLWHVLRCLSRLNLRPVRSKTPKPLDNGVWRCVSHPVSWERRRVRRQHPEAPGRESSPLHGPSETCFEH